ncbi:TPA: HAD hydrolase family protein [Enterococcus faecalis]|uniref:HAD family hydrolase n=1 Tax=Enterococcus faecalis TaxID=1351 RepID=UPI001CADA7B8|nr:HAD hydrolase family protein [Enterococcus faecalis]HBI3767429.1 HAD hydrolase family protein [Enterococcus faecalis]
MIKIILSDLDGTILYRKSHDGSKFISFETRDLISDMKSNQYLDYFIIATGRNLDSFRKATEKYNINFFDYAICANGAIVINNKFEIVYQSYFKALQIQKINKRLQLYEKEILKIEKGLYTGKLYSINLTMSSEKVTQSISKELTLCIPELVVNPNSVYLDITPFQTGKWKTYDRIFLNNIYNYRTFSIGDGENDIDILANSDYSCSFHYAKQIVKNYSREVVSDFEAGLRTAVDFFC